MKKILLLLILFVLPTAVFAENVTPPSSTPIRVASVNIQNALILSAQNNVITLSFMLTNGTGMQSGVRYGVQLVSIADGKQVIADEKIYDETLTLPEHSTTKRQITYTAPAQLQGTFTLYITSQNSKGFPYGIASLGTVSLTATAQGVFIKPQSCVSSSGTHMTSIDQPLTIKPKDVLQLHCDVTNNTGTPVTLTPTVETRYQSAYGEIADQTESSLGTVTLAAGETKNIELTLPTGVKPQSYVALVTLTSTSNTSNTVTVPYVVSGTTATIENLTFDKQSYQKGDTAQATLLYVSRSFSGNATVALSDHRGAPCAETVTQQLTEENPIVIMPIHITAPCTGPQATVTIHDTDGSTLDTATFSVPVQRSLNPLMVAGIIIISILVLGIPMIIRKKKIPPAATTVVALLFIFIPFVRAHADTYYYSASGYRGQAQLVVNIDNTTYAAGVPINVTASITSQSADSWPIYLTASTNGGTATTIFPLSSLAPNTTTGNKTITLYAPNTSGNYSVDFQVGVEQRLIMGNTTGGATSAQGCGYSYAVDDHSYYQPLPYNPGGPSTGSYMYLSAADYGNNIPFKGGNLWYVFQYEYSSVNAPGWNYSNVYSVQIDNTGKILGSVTC